MSVVAAYAYVEGRRARAIDLNDPATLELRADEVAWIGLYEPTDAELAVLQRRFHLHPLAVEDASNAHQLPKLDVYGDQLFVLARTAQLEEDGRISYGETAIFVGPSHIITVRHGSARDGGRMASDDDWRLLGQERYLAGRELERRPWSTDRDDWDHDHCEFCKATFGPEGASYAELTEGYVTADDRYYWICPPCFVDFQARFEWTVRP